jgi:endonuclease/exonuclease/phosphatase family metal-dependent hydrolase
MATASPQAPQQRIIIEQLCCANARRDEQQLHYRYGARSPQFHQHFRNMITSKERPTIISIKELRTCNSNPSANTPPVLMTPGQQVQELAASGEYTIASIDCTALSYTSKTLPRRGDYNPFYIAQLYCHTQVEKLRAHCFRFYDLFNNSESVPTAGCAVLCVLYCLRDPVTGIPDMTRQFLVESYHFPMAGAHKLRISEYLRDGGVFSVQRAGVFTECGLNSDNIPIVRTGDFNLFKDEATYAATYDNMTAGYEDVTTPHLTDESEDNPRRMYGTFYPFPHDTPAVVIARPTENAPNTSMLDFMFLKYSTRIRCVRSYVITATCNPSAKDERVTFDERTQPLSDHLPLVGVFEYL